MKMPQSISSRSLLQSSLIIVTGLLFIGVEVDGFGELSVASLRQPSDSPASLQSQLQNPNSRKKKILYSRTYEDFRPIARFETNKSQQEHPQLLAESRKQSLILWAQLHRNPDQPLIRPPAGLGPSPSTTIPIRPLLVDRSGIRPPVLDPPAARPPVVDPPGIQPPGLDPPVARPPVADPGSETGTPPSAETGSSGQTLITFEKKDCTNCEESSSLLSPAAYFFDLQHFVQNSFEELNTNQKMKDRFKQDFQAIPIDPGTAKTKNYIQFTNEILENFIADLKGKNWPNLVGTQSQDENNLQARNEIYEAFKCNTTEQAITSPPIGSGTPGERPLSSPPAGGDTPGERELSDSDRPLTANGETLCHNPFKVNEPSFDTEVLTDIFEAYLHEFGTTRQEIKSLHNLPQLLQAKAADEYGFITHRLRRLPPGSASGVATSRDPFKDFFHLAPIAHPPNLMVGMAIPPVSSPAKGLYVATADNRFHYLRPGPGFVWTDIGETKPVQAMTIVNDQLFVIGSDEQHQIWLRDSLEPKGYWHYKGTGPNITALTTVHLTTQTVVGATASGELVKWEPTLKKWLTLSLNGLPNVISLAWVQNPQTGGTLFALTKNNEQTQLHHTSFSRSTLSQILSSPESGVIPTERSSTPQAERSSWTVTGPFTNLKSLAGRGRQLFVVESLPSFWSETHLTDKAITYKKNQSPQGKASQGMAF